MALMRVRDHRQATRHLVKFWDNSRAIDFLAAESLSDAIDKAAKRLCILKKKYGDRVGYGIEDLAGHTCRTW
jgi:hypothetical protein